jgi:hypothetical protein
MKFPSGGSKYQVSVDGRLMPLWGKGWKASVLSRPQPEVDGGGG